MAYVSKKDQMRYIELSNYIVDYNDGDVQMFEGVRDLTPLFPLNEKMMLISFCCAGSQKLIVNGHETEIQQGYLLLCPPTVRVECLEHSDDFDCKVVSISDSLIRALLRDKTDVWHHMVYVNQQLVLPLPNGCRDDLSLYYALIKLKLKRDSQAPYEILMALLRALLLELCFMIELDGGLQHEQRLSQGKVLFNRFLSIISSSAVKRQPITFYAGQLAITPKYLTMLCLKYSNKTASEWVAQYTVEEIRYFLRSTELSIKEISARLGFSNMSHFGSYVRKHLGMSPSEFRYSKKG